MLLPKKHTITWEALLFLEGDNILSALQNEAVILKWFQPLCWSACLHFTLALSSFSAVLVSVPFLVFPVLPKAQSPWDTWESAFCFTWAMNVLNISVAPFLVSQRERERGYGEREESQSKGEGGREKEGRGEKRGKRRRKGERMCMQERKAMWQLLDSQAKI